jgi:hypothetical protein
MDSVFNPSQEGVGVWHSFGDQWDFLGEILFARAQTASFSLSSREAFTKIVPDPDFTPFTKR